MHEPVAFKKIDTSIQLTPVEALASSLNYYGSVNMDYLVPVSYTHLHKWEYYKNSTVYI